MSNKLLVMKNLNISYKDKLVVKDFNLEIDNGEIISIVGESGSGKTSVIRSIMNLLNNEGKVSSGEILFFGESILNKNKEQMRDIRGKDISMIFQDAGNMINPIRKIGSQFIEYILTHKKMSKAEAKNIAIESIKKVHLPDPENIMNSYAFKLSGGQRQRVGIAMAMAFSPKLLLADEPTSALDVTIQTQIVKEIIELNKKFHTAVIMVTHNIGMALYMSKKIIVMKDGEIVDFGDKNDILNNAKSKYTKSLLASIPKIGG